MKLNRAIGSFVLAMLPVLSSSSGGCGGSVKLGQENSGGDNGTGATPGTSVGGAGNGSSTGGNGANGGNGSCHIARCQNHVYDCGDCSDNDGDGQVDAQDPDCLGPCDNTEDSYFGGIPGQNNAPCKQDCYFDQDSGSGNDNCNWSHRCDPLSVAPNFPPEDETCAYDPDAKVPGAQQSSCDELFKTQSAECKSFCGPLTPNGCDCFGCCELPAGAGKFVWLGSEVDKQGSCDRDHVSDPARCKPCTPVPGCFNPCGRCELCLGKTTLPPDCVGTGGAGGSGGTGGVGGSSGGFGGTGGDSQCPPELQPCGLPGQDACPDNYYCTTGCCFRIPS